MPLHGGQRIRLHGIDAPKSAQFCEKDAKQYRCGQQAPSALSDTLGRATIRCEKRDIDRFCSFSSGLNSPNAQN
jgi:endonuclease YncB( thermonuclease family)